MRTHQFLVTVRTTEGVDAIKEMIKADIGCMQGSYPPEERYELYDVTVQKVNKP
jgi:hypothetical protein